MSSLLGLRDASMIRKVQLLIKALEIVSPESSILVATMVGGLTTLMTRLTRPCYVLATGAS